MVDIDREIFELYELQNGEYILTNHNFNNPTTFILDEGCTVEVTLKEIWGVK